MGRIAKTFLPEFCDWTSILCWSRKAKIKRTVTVVICTIATSILCSIAFGQNRSQQIANLKTRLAPALELSITELTIALSLKIHEKLEGASVIADDGEKTFLGKIDNNLSPDSIFNTIGIHGSDISPTSIWNDIGRFGGTISRCSPFNDMSSSPPLIVKNGEVVGKLTVNDMIAGAVDPHLLKCLYK